jgi:hypothetical protein
MDDSSAGLPRDIAPRRRRDWDGVAAIIAALVGLLALCESQTGSELNSILPECVNE